jgi:hypothetical protein
MGEIRRWFERANTSTAANHCNPVEVTMARHPRASMFVEIAVGTAILAVALFTIVELARVAGMMQLDGIFSWI